MSEAPTYLDFYKTFHHKAYRPGVTEVYSNFTTRHGNHTNIPSGSTCFVAGLQACIYKIIVHEWHKFFSANTEQDAVNLYEEIVSHGLGRPETADHLRKLYQLGYLPIEFKALPEGTEVPYGIPHFTIRSTHPEFGWLTNMLETVISAEVWPVQTALTTAVAYYRNFEKYAEMTGSPKEFIPFQGHDFSFRGMMGVEAAKLTGMGHLMSGFIGSDTVCAAVALHKYYDANLDRENPCTTIASVDATEHSVQCSFEENDEDYIDYCMDHASPDGILSLVSDAYDFWKLVTEFIPSRKEKIMNRNGKIVIRPDSGDPVKILTGYIVTSNPRETLQDDWEVFLTPDGKYYLKEDCEYDHYLDYSIKKDALALPRHVVMGLVQVLWEEFGGTRTKKLFKVLDEHIGCIYGDSITLERQEEILKRLAYKGFASCNVVLGIGSYTYQFVTRDTHGSAVKATSIKINDQERVSIHKDPKTGDKTKKSAKGLLFVGHNGQDYYLEDDVSEEKENSKDNLLKTVWKDGNWYREINLQQIRNNVSKNLTAWEE